jgi:hypothetical protein
MLSLIEKGAEKMVLLNGVRKADRLISFSKAIGHTALISCAGLVLGVITKLLDIYTTNLGNIFSQMSVWIFLCTLIAIYSSTAERAAVNVFGFCAGMLIAYYITAELTASFYSTLFIYGWILFALFSPLMGFSVWYAKGKVWISKIISVCIIIVMLSAAIVLFDKIRIADIAFAILTSVFLFKK